MSDLFARLAAKYSGPNPAGPNPAGPNPAGPRAASTTAAAVRPQLPPRFGPARRAGYDVPRPAAEHRPAPATEVQLAAAPAPPGRADDERPAAARTHSAVRPDRETVAVNDGRAAASSRALPPSPSAAPAPHPTEPPPAHSRPAATPVAAPPPDRSPRPSTMRRPIEAEPSIRPRESRPVSASLPAPSIASRAEQETPRPHREAARRPVFAAPVAPAAAPVARPQPPVRRSASAAAATPQPPVVRVTIGRVDIRADRPDHAVAAVSAPAPPAAAPISLGDYLRGRDT